MSRYNMVDQRVIDELTLIVGSTGVVTDVDKMAAYDRDETSEAEYRRMPEVVVKPDNTEQVSKVLRLANREMIPVTPRGSGTGLSAGCVPMYGGIVMSMERMNRIVEVDTSNLFIVVEPGVTTGEVQRKAREVGLLYAGDPCSAESSQIGGNVAENAGGNKAVRYGTTGRYVHGLEVVLPSGEVMTVGGKCVKDVAGYDLVKLFVGSEGTLGVVTRVWLKLLPLPKFKVDLLAPFGAMQAAIDAVPRIMTAGGIVPTSVEFMDALSIKAAAEYLNATLPHSDAGAYIIVELEANSQQQVEADYEAVGELLLDCGALEVYVADNLSTSQRIWQARKCVAEALRLISPVYCMEDITVPTSEIPGFIAEIARISERHDLMIPCFGHAGDGNIHATLLKQDMDDSRWEECKCHALQEMYEAAYRRGGNLSGEHGIGAKRIRHLERFSDPVALSVARSIKVALDPKLILNPGKVVNFAG